MESRDQPSLTPGEAGVCGMLHACDLRVPMQVLKGLIRSFFFYINEAIRKAFFLQFLLKGLIKVLFLVQ